MALRRTSTVQSVMLTADDVVMAEHNIISALRNKDVVPDGTHVSARSYLDQQRFTTTGLALSGGGIRSASFCLGSLQALAKFRAFERFDYLSTVSGGGYIGIATCAQLLRSGGKFPWFDVNEHKDTPDVQAIRDKANYLRAGYAVEMLKNLAIYLRGVVVNVALVLPALLGLAALTLAFNPSVNAIRQPDLFGHTIGAIIPAGQQPVGLDWFPLTLLALGSAAVAFWTWAIGVAKGTEAGLSNWLLAAAKWIVPALCFVFLIELQPFFISKMLGDPPQPKAISCAMDQFQASCAGGAGAACKMAEAQFSCGALTDTAAARVAAPAAQDRLSDAINNLSAWLVGYVTPLLALLAFVSQHLGSYLKSDKDSEGAFGRLKRTLGTSLVWAGAALLLPALFWLVYLLLVLNGFGGKVEDDATGRWFAVVYGASAVALGAASLLFEPNSNSIHRLYRDRLGQAFLVEKIHAKTTLAEQPVSALQGVLPYLVVNTALNVQRDAEVNKRGRDADSFVFTPGHLGSKATGYVPIQEYERSGLEPDLDLATVMAVSGAAASSNMGARTMKPLRWALAFFNVRLGYWLENPLKLSGATDLKSVWFYFLQELQGRLHSKLEKVYLTDGGHFDNLGLYELLRRRCELIVVVDAEADPEMTFPSFVAVQRHARIDLGVKIELCWKPIAAATHKAMTGANGGETSPHCAIGRIDYENGPPGILLYVKSSLTGDENDPILDYNRRYRAFPHESTGDQFFSEEQFEVYRALGFHAVNGVLSGSAKAVATDGSLQSLRNRRARGFGVREAARMLGL